MSIEILNLLKEEVERVFGRKILTASDCQNLSKDIYQQTKSGLSLNTLRRTFSLMKSKYQPSTFTLDLLSKYCGFSSFQNFLSLKKNISGNHNTQLGLLNFLVLLFKDFDVKSVDDITYINLIHEIITNLERWPDVIDQFQSEIAKTANGQIFYYEQFVNIDKLNSFSGDGLRYYLHEKKTPQAQMFGHSLLCFNAWLTMNKEEIKEHWLKVLAYKIDDTIHPFVCGRYFATQLYYAEAFAGDVEPVLNKAREFYAEIKLSKHHQSFPCFEYILSEALVLIRQYDEALFYINEAIKKRNSHVPPHIDLRLFESIYHFQAIALAKIGKVEKSKDILDTISMRNFSFLSRKFNSILYLSQKHSFYKRDFLQKQLQYLVCQTGFEKLVANNFETPKVTIQHDYQFVGKNGQA